MAQPNNWDGVINLSTIDYFVALVSGEQAASIRQIEGYEFVELDWIEDNYSQYFTDTYTYVCIDIRDEAWEKVVAKFRIKADLEKTSDTASCILFDTEHRALLVEFD